MAKILRWYGKTDEEIKALPFKEFLNFVPSRARRTLQREMTQQQKRLMQKLSTDDRDLKTRSSNVIIVPSMLGKTIKIYNGKEYFPVEINSEMLGHYLGEFVITRKMVTHGSAGLGATKSSRAVSAK
ncbi:ribosomal protein S19 family protein [Candidatus Woesearchaeota archaeon]|nr:ribosomal protein S19 family protein [Candidatus Woesearchaeota archaeon]